MTWTNKHECLLAHEDGSYEWLSPSDYRVAEVRLLHGSGIVGEVSRRRVDDNLLIQGDALHALTSLLKLPEFAREYAGKVQLVYLDPPFNTGQAFEHYDDALEHSVWLTMMRDRLWQIKSLLSDTGSVWVHCDDAEQHRLRCLMDEVFGPGSFVATIVWQKRYSRENRPAIGAAHDLIHVYSPDPDRWKRTRNLLPLDEKTRKQYTNPNNDPRGPWRSIAMNAQGYRANQMYEIVAPSGNIKRPPKGSCWKYIRPTYDALVAEGRIYFGRNGDGQPSIIRYLSEVEGLVPWTWWPHDEVGHNDEAKREVQTLFGEDVAFATPKPERLMHRIITIATRPGDLVLDCFMGSGTTAAVAQKMGRRWVGIERNDVTVGAYATPRLTSVVEGRDGGGVSDTTSWKGGGGFRRLAVGPSMFEADDAGLVYLADGMINGTLAEAAAAQLGYDYQPEPPFAGRKGRARLAVVDGVVNEAVVRLLVAALGENERVLVCGTGIDPEARPVLRELRQGSTLRKIPAALLERYRSPRQQLPSEAAEAQAAASTGIGN